MSVNMCTCIDSAIGRTNTESIILQYIQQKHL